MSDEKCSSSNTKDAWDDDSSRRRPAADGAVMDESDDDESITLQEIVEIDERLESDARALLGAANESVCTYPEGYPPRQMIYTCATCFPTMKRDLTTLEPLPTAICYGCSMNCHSGHSLLELYTKRRVCCDCGNSKFRHPCQLYPGKKMLNTWNQYNHNYEGRYCACDRPYADSVPLYGYDEIWEEGGVMVQCIVCEDWFHVNHLTLHPDFVHKEAEEIVCGLCAKKKEFLKYYANGVYEGDEQIALKGLDKVETESKEECKLKILKKIYEEKLKKEAESGKTGSGDGKKDSPGQQEAGDELSKQAEKEEVGKVVVEEEQEQLSELTGKDDVEKAKAKEKLPEAASSGTKREGDGKEVRKDKEIKFKRCGVLLFVTAKWREELCRCKECMRLYEREEVEYLLDWEDTLAAYVRKSSGHEPTAGPSQEAEEKRVIDGLVSMAGRDGAISIIQGYEKMKGKLTEMMAKKAANNSTVTEEDVKRVFNELRGERKRPRLDDDDDED